MSRWSGIAIWGLLALTLAGCPTSDPVEIPAPATATSVDVAEITSSDAPQVSYTETELAHPELRSAFFVPYDNEWNRNLDTLQFGDGATLGVTHRGCLPGRSRGTYTWLEEGETVLLTARVGSSRELVFSEYDPNTGILTWGGHPYRREVSSERR